MNDMALFSSGEFATMCNVSRELLLYYDRIGILKPKVVRDNRYRYYSVEQLYLFDAIRFFVDAGMSTKEVKDYFDHRSTSLFLESIEGNIKNMEEQRDILDAKIGMMERMLYITHRSLLFPKEEPRLSFWDEFCMLVTDIPDDTESAYIQAVCDHSDFCRNVAHVSKFPMGRVAKALDRNNLSDIEYQQIMTWTSKPAETSQLASRLKIRPRGNCAVILHQGGREGLPEVYGRLLDYIEENGLIACSPAYELDVNTYLMSDSSEDYLIHISILVDAGPESTHIPSRQPV